MLLACVPRPDNGTKIHLPSWTVVPARPDEASSGRAGRLYIWNLPLLVAPSDFIGINFFLSRRTVSSLLFFRRPPALTLGPNLILSPGLANNLLLLVPSLVAVNESLLPYCR